MTSQHQRMNRTKIVAYHYSEFGVQNMHMTNFDDMNGENDENGHNTQYAFSTAELYGQRNNTARPLIPRHEIQSANTEETWQANNVIGSNVNNNAFIITSHFRRVINRFQTDLFTIFPNIPCAYCGVLSSRRMVKWLTIEQAVDETEKFELSTVLHIPIHTDRKGRVAICTQCKTKPRQTIRAGPWPHTLLQIPQRSKMFLSPIKLNCSLGRTQSHSGTEYHNPFSTYRTLSGNNIIQFRLI
jgi:hypothetical protein